MVEFLPSKQGVAGSNPVSRSTDLVCKSMLIHRSWREKRTFKRYHTGRKNMSYTVKHESLESLATYWVDESYSLNWEPLFVLPVWLKVWWQKIGGEAELYLSTIRQGEKIIGVSPLMVREGKASLVGSVDVCDYLDFVIAPAWEQDFFTVLLDDLKERGISLLEMSSLRPDSTVLTHLVNIARDKGYDVLCQPEDVSAEMDLPDNWEDYLALLNTKQRHEIRRKLRRLSEAGKVDYHFVDNNAEVSHGMDIFLKMFTESREDKAEFLTMQMESFLRGMADNMAEAGLLRFGVLELDTVPVAMIICFDYHDCLYLYNSGYDPRYNTLSVGLLSKVLCIQECIQEGKKRFDFLKGSDAYKYRLGGREVYLQRCQIAIK